LRLKSFELRMMPVSLRFAAQDFLRQQRLAPQGYESFGVEIFWVERPQSHCKSETNSAGTGEW
jgi:hypothetical protein